MSSDSSPAGALSGQLALVTGASRGIGRAIAMRLAAAGARVIGTATSEAGAAAIGEALSPLGGEARVLDVRDPVAIDALVKELETVSVLVNNAGVTRDQLVLRMKDEDWQQVLETDLTSVFRCSRSVLRGMMKVRYGRIVSVGSVVGSMGNMGQGNYAAAKAGLVGFSKSLAAEIGTRGITVNVVAPGFIDTDMTRQLPEAARKTLLERTLIPRFGSVDDVAAAVLYLASPDAGYVTGQTLHVNGGMYMQ